MEGKFSTLRELLKNVLCDIDSLCNTQIYTEEDGKKMKQFFEKNQRFLDLDQSVLLHSDVHESNIISLQDDITFIDFADLQSGPPMMV